MDNKESYRSLVYELTPLIVKEIIERLHWLSDSFVPSGEDSGRANDSASRKEAKQMVELMRMKIRKRNQFKQPDKLHFPK